MAWLTLNKKAGEGKVCFNTDQIVALVPDRENGKHVATEVYTTNQSVHLRVVETLEEIRAMAQTAPR